MVQAAHIRLLVVDDEAFVREATILALDRQPDLQVVGEADSGAAAIERLRELDARVDVVLMDVGMPGMSGLEATRAIHAEWPACAVLLLTSYEQFSDAAIRAGARGYVLKSSRTDDILTAIRSVARGTMFAQAWRGAADTLLSDAEVRVLELIAQSCSNADIARRLGWSERAVKTHVANICEKLGANGREHAVLLGLRRGDIR